MISVSKDSPIFAKKAVLCEKIRPIKVKSFWKTHFDLNQTWEIGFTKNCQLW